MYYVVLLAAFLLLLAGLALMWQSRKMRLRSGLPVGTIIYSDTNEWQKQEEPIISRKFGIVGKPDYLVTLKKGRQTLTIPVEVKSRRRPETPFDSHVLQLGAYCLLVEDTFKQRPPYGLLHYRDDTIQIPFSNELRNQVIHAAKAIRRNRSAANVHRHHQAAGRCVGCGYKHECGEELG
ncbi:MAG: PD-(D/E)XK nuclease family protein [Chloroflexota bacterium]